MDAQGEEQLPGAESEIHCGPELLGLRRDMRASNSSKQSIILMHISNTKVCLYAPQAGPTARDDKHGGNTEGFEQVQYSAPLNPSSFTTHEGALDD